MSESSAGRWPRGMDAKSASDYCGFDVRRTPGAPAPVRPSPKRAVWLREDLDAWLDRLAKKDQHESPRSVWDD